MGYDIKTAQEPSQRVLSPIEEAAAAKEPEREALALDIQRFLEGGGRIVHVPNLKPYGDKLRDMRAGLIPTITFDEISTRWGIPTKSLAPVLAKWQSLIYIVKNGQRIYALDDIEICEKQKNHKNNLFKR